MTKFIIILKLFFRNPVSTIRHFSFRRLLILFKAIEEEDPLEIEKNLLAIETSSNKERQSPVVDIIREVKHKGSYPFDKDYYISQLKNINKFDKQAIYNYEHYLSSGHLLGVSPNVYFDEPYYRSQITKFEDIPAFEHYCNNFKENIFISPHPLIDINHIISEGKILEEDGQNIIEKINNYYNKKTVHYRSPSPLFAAQWYAEKISQYGYNPFNHFLRTHETSGHPLSYPEVYEKHVCCKENYLVNIARVLLTYKVPKNPDTDLVSIIILNWNKSILTLQCVATTLMNTKYDNYEIVLVDNGSDPEDLIILQKYLVGQVKLICNKTNRFFGEANNIGVEHSLGKYILFLNNDAFPHVNWLCPLVEKIKSNKNIGGVGSILLFPDGKIQETGGQINLNGVITQENKGRHVFDLSNLISRQTEYKSAAAFIMNKSDFFKIRGFDYIYEPAYFEDTDLCMKLTQINKKIFSCMESRVTHIENLTSKSKGIGFNFHDNVNVNRKKFSDRWDEYIASAGTQSKVIRNFKENKYDFYHNIVPSDSTRLAIVYTPYNLVPGGGEKYTLSIAISLLKKEFRVILATEVRFSKLRLLNVSEDLGLPIDLISQIHISPIWELQSINPDIFVSIGNSIMPDQKGKGKINFYHCQFPFPVNNKSFLSKGMINLETYQSIIVNSNYTAKYMYSSLESFGVSTIPYIKVIYPPVSSFDQPSFDDKIPGSILSIGRFFIGGHNKNHEFLIDSFISLYKSNKNISLNLVGGTYPEIQHQNYIKKLLRKAKGYPIYFHFDASYEKLKDLLRTSQIYWHATGFGIDHIFFPEKMEHFGITVVESLLNGCIPLAYGYGGPKEILESLPQHLYYTQNELLEKTDYFIREYDIDLNELVSLGNKYTAKSFYKTMNNLIYETVN